MLPGLRVRFPTVEEESERKYVPPARLLLIQSARTLFKLFSVQTAELNMKVESGLKTTNVRIHRVDHQIWMMQRAHTHTCAVRCS